MAKYMELAETTNEFIKTAFELYKEMLESNNRLDKSKEPIEPKLKEFAILLGTIYNLGIRTAPRPTQSTVRFRAVEQALRGLPVKATMKEVKDEKTGNSFNHLELT